MTVSEKQEKLKKYNSKQSRRGNQEREDGIDLQTNHSQQKNERYNNNNNLKSIPEHIYVLH